MDIILSIALGISLAGRFGELPLTDVLAWTASTTGLVCLGCATLSGALNGLS